VQPHARERPREGRQQVVGIGRAQRRGTG
jgi:hypothetical protein